jgi:hypothetical protein
MASRFLQLFKRGRYVSVRSLAAAEGSDATRGKKHEERERFSVAAVAFCLEHDKKFRRHFLMVIAGLAPNEIISITLEPKEWGDLVLDGPRNVLVLEFKLAALLQDHQSPEARIFSETGYGARIQKRFGASRKTVRYIVVGKEFQSRVREGLLCSAVPWPKLIPHDRRESRIENDLYDCLGYLGAPVFLNRHMKNPKLTLDAQRAMSIYGKLEHALANEGLPIGGSDSDHTCLGLKFSKARASLGTLHHNLVKFVEPNGQSVGWIGYEILEDFPKDKAIHLAVYFYATKKTTSRVRHRLERRGMGSVDTDGTTVLIRTPGHKSTNDIAWFQKVLNAVGRS